MRAERWQQLDRIFVEALRLPAERRAGFVTGACQDDQGLRAEALSLLAAADASGEFMSKPAIERLSKVIAAEGWSLRPGETVGAYTVLRLLGSGGSGEVWRARDERLGRDVAIKVLLPHLSSDAGRVRRFADEARTAGGISHANILTVYDVGEHQGTPFLVTECLEGQSLRQRIEAGPVPQAEAIAIALGVARGLAAAHGRGIIHRDLKPENLFLNRDGCVKILDFGLAKLLLPALRAGSPSHTMTGVIAGTAGYMAPEQVRGQDVDVRADLFALGVILYEILAGRHPYKGDTTFDTLHAILTASPSTLVADNCSIDPALVRIVSRLLDKTPEARFQSAADLAWGLEQVGPSGMRRVEEPVAQSGAGGSGATRLRLALAVAAVVAAVASALWLGRTQPSPLPPAVTRFTWTLPAGVGLDSAPLVSPDSRYIAFVGADGSRRRLFIRPLDALEATVVPGSEEARQPFWSPDSQWVGFFARSRLLKVSVAGGVPLTIVDAPSGPAAGTRRTERGGTWSSTGPIVYGPGYGVPSLSQVPGDTGNTTAITVLARTRGDASHRWPAFLPDGKHFLYFVLGATEGRRGVYIGNVDGAPEEPSLRLLQSDSEAVYAPLPERDRGVLLYVAKGRVQAQLFDSASRSLTGPAQPLPVEAGGPTPYRSSTLSASADVLAYSASPIPYGNLLSSISESGDGLAVVSEREAQQWPRISPDGRSLAWLRIDPLVGNADIWVEDLARLTRVRVTTASERDVMHVWSPDGSRLAYRSDVLDRRRLNIIAADGSGVMDTLTCPQQYCEPTDWSADGRTLIVNAVTEHGADVWAVAVASGGKTGPLLSEPFTERDGRLSPDGRWIAYVSEESGRPEVSIRSLAGPPRRYVVSHTGGDQPVWSRQGPALFYVDVDGRLRKVAIRETGAGLTFSATAVLPVPSIGSGHASTQYDVGPDGRIYFVDLREPPRENEIRVVLGWRRLLRPLP